MSVRDICICTETERKLRPFHACPAHNAAKDAQPVPDRPGDRDQQQATEHGPGKCVTIEDANRVLADERHGRDRALAAARAEESARWRAKIEGLADDVTRDARTDRETALWVVGAFRALLDCGQR